MTMFSFKSALLGAALGLAFIGGVSTVKAQMSPQSTTAHPINSAQPSSTPGGMNGGMMQMMNDPVAMCDRMMHAIATNPAMHKQMNELMRRAMSGTMQNPR